MLSPLKKLYICTISLTKNLETMNSIDKNNFHEGTAGVFIPCEMPSETPDFISKDETGGISSMYYYTDKGVVRVSNHWGKVSSCKWILAGFSEFQIKDCCFTKENIAAYCSFSDLEIKTSEMKSISTKFQLEKFSATNKEEKEVIRKGYIKQMLLMFNLPENIMLYIPSVC